MEQTERQALLQKALEKAASFCAYQDRSEWEVRERLAKFELAEKEVDVIVEYLRAEKFLDEQRFVKAYVLGKFRNNGWGRLKIKQGLLQKGIVPSLASEAICAIGEEAYLDFLQQMLIQKKKSITGGVEKLQMKQKLYRFALGRGFEHHLVMELLGKILESEN